jgi:hypothetical protein
MSEINHPEILFGKESMVSTRVRFPKEAGINN